MVSCDGRAGAPPGAPAGGVPIRRLVSTTTVFDRPWLKLCFTVPVETLPPTRGFSVRGVRPSRFWSLVLSSLVSLMRLLYLTLAKSARCELSVLTNNS